MERDEIRKLATLEDSHWWYRERRHLIARQVRQLSPGRALDIGAAAGGNTRVLQRLGWDAFALEYSHDGAQIAGGRGLPVLRADARQLPFGDGSLDLTMAFDVLEHIENDRLVVQEMCRVTRPGGVLLIAVPADPRLWSAHDVAVSHVRRYTRESLLSLLQSADLDVVTIKSWNVLMRPVAKWHRRRSTGSDLSEPSALMNWGLGAIVAAERYLPVSSLPGVSLMVHARRR